MYGMIYVAFALWMFLILFMAIGVHALWSRMVRPAWVSWALLPGTVVSEMAYIFGCLITGGEVRRAKILPGAGEGKSGRDCEPATDVTPRLKVIGPTVASLAAVVACVGGIVLAHTFLGEPVIREFVGRFGSAALPRGVPLSATAFWDQFRIQGALLERMTDTWTRVDWLDWRAGLFVYLTICFAVRLSPGRRDLRFALLGVLVLTGTLAAIEAVRGDLLGQIWPLLTYVWTALLFLLLVTLLLQGIVALVQVVLGGKAPKTAKA